MPIRLLTTAVLFSSLACAQFISFGIIGGASVTDDFRTSIQPAGAPPAPNILSTDYSTSQRYIAGGMLEFQLPQNWSVEVDGLYHPLRYNSAGILPNGLLNSVSPSPVITWEFPLLAKYRFHWGAWRPFVEAGPTFRTAGNLNQANPSHYGVAAGAGAEVLLGKFRVAPEVRYIRWAADSPFAVRTRSDQIEVLTSFSTGGVAESARAYARRISVGVVMGATLTPDYRGVHGTNSYISSDGTIAAYTYSDFPGPRSFLVGPMVEMSIGKGFYVEADAIHRPMRSQENVDGAPSSSRTIGTWNFPVLAKYKFSGRGLKPFVEAGPSFRRANLLNGASPYGVTAGAGVETHFHRLAIAPAVRYTYWGKNSLDYPGAFLPFRNQVEVLGGFSF